MSPQPTPPWWADRSEVSHRKPAARGAGARRRFGATWWGRAWLDALEHRAGLDPNRLPRGRSYARSGAVGELMIDSGTVSADVQGSRKQPYRVVVHVTAFTAKEWERALDAIASRIGHTAALLDGELPPEVEADVAASGRSLLPVAGEVVPRCSCPDWASPCKHAAAVCYLVADVLDADPFALLQLRGRDRESVLAALRARRGGSGESVPGSSANVADEGLLARDAYAAWAARAGDDQGVAPVAPAPLAPPARPGRPAVPVLEPGPDSGVDVDGLARLAADVAQLAWELAMRTSDGGLGLTGDEDLARRAAAALGVRSSDELARAAGMPPRELTSWALAWRYGGADGLRALRQVWTPPASEVAAAQEVLAADGPGAITVWRNRLTRGRLQLRLDQDGRWWLFRRSVDQWDLTGPAAATPAAALAARE